MVPSAPALLLLLSWASQRAVAEICRGAHCSGGPREPCSGGHCPGSRAARPQGAAAHIVASQHHVYSPRAASATRASFQPLRGRHGDASGAEGGGGARLGAQEVPPAGCTDVDCSAPPKPGNDTRECRGIECRLPPRMRGQQRGRACAGERCAAAPEPSVSSSPRPLLHLPDRAAQFLGDFPDLDDPPPELGAAPLGVQLTCDIKPGENEVPSEDALILHLQLAKGQEKLVEALRAQQVVIRDLQQKLVDQQEALLSQQRAILEHQRGMYEQMDAVKAQLGLVSDTFKQVSVQGLQGELQNYFESHLAGLQNQARGHLWKPGTSDKAGAAPKSMDVTGEAHLPRPLLGCPAPCGRDEYCNFQKEPPGCERCTLCPPGFFLTSQCSATADRMCQDRDECLELPRICGERVKCLNTPGGFRCLGVSERDVPAGFCGHDYFHNRELQECQACSDCDGEPVSVPCTATSDAVCGTSSESRLSQTWAAQVAVPARTSGTHVFPGLQMNIRGAEPRDLLSIEEGRLTFRQHGLVWLDHNFAVKHSCRNFLQVGMRLNGSQEDEGQDLSGVRIEQPDGKHFQGVSVSACVEVEPNHTLTLVLRSPNHHCNQSKDLQVYDIAAPSFSLLWLSHDTGAVAMTAQMTLLTHYQASYRPTFRTASVSDPYMITLTHDNRGVRFTESGVVKFVLQHALYAMGQACVREGFSLLAYTTHNGTGQEVTQAFKAGVNYRDTSITLSGTVSVLGGDALGFEITSPAQCNVRYFGDSTGISMLSLIWIPSALSSSLAATVAKTGLPFGAVRNKPLLFRQVSPDAPQVHLARSGEPNSQKSFIFREKGTINVALNLKLIHSCSVVKLTLQQVGGRGRPSGPLAQQVSGSMPEGSLWTSIGLRASLEVQNGTAVFVTLDCLRGRVNQITHEGGTNISILWVAA